MILGRGAILRAIDAGEIVITPFRRENVGPNSVNVHLHDELLVYSHAVLDMAEDNPTERIAIPPGGLVLEPGRLYLGRTVEWTEAHAYVPMLEGRSSTGRLGLDVHVSAGFGDLGVKCCWTLELRAVQPLRIYPFVAVAQLYYHQITGADGGYDGKYQDAKDVHPSRLHHEFDQPLRQAKADSDRRSA